MKFENFQNLSGMLISFEVRSQDIQNVGSTFVWMSSIPVKDSSVVVAADQIVQEGIDHWAGRWYKQKHINVNLSHKFCMVAGEGNPSINSSININIGPSYHPAIITRVKHSKILGSIMANFPPSQN